MNDIRNLAIYHDPVSKPLVDEIERLRTENEELNAGLPWQLAKWKDDNERLRAEIERLRADNQKLSEWESETWKAMKSEIERLRELVRDAAEHLRFHGRSAEAKKFLRALEGK